MSADLMKEDLFANLPEEMTREILRRVPIKSLFRSKCVCKSWRDLIDEPEFKSSYSPKPCLAFSYGNTYMVYDDEARKPLFRFPMKQPCTCSEESDHDSYVIDSTDGLLLAIDKCSETLLVCNPMTREYVAIPSLDKHSHSWRNLFGFGVNKISGQCKIFLWCEVSPELFKCYVYTLGGGGGGSWRIISATTPGSPRMMIDNNALFCKGNLHWLTNYAAFEKKQFICCFDLETELFTGFYRRPRGFNSALYGQYTLCILEGRLCLCKYSYYRVVIWWMDTYGDENSWVKVYTMFHSTPDTHGHPFKVLDNGDLLLATNNCSRLFIYSKNTEHITTHSLFLCPSGFVYNVVTYTPSFLSLEAMGIHKVQSLNLY